MWLLSMIAVSHPRVAAAVVFLGVAVTFLANGIPQNSRESPNLIVNSSFGFGGIGWYFDAARHEVVLRNGDAGRVAVLESRQAGWERHLTSRAFKVAPEGSYTVSFDLLVFNAPKEHLTLRVEGFDQSGVFSAVASTEGWQKWGRVSDGNGIAIAIDGELGWKRVVENLGTPPDLVHYLRVSIVSDGESGDPYGAFAFVDHVQVALAGHHASYHPGSLPALSDAFAAVAALRGDAHRSVVDVRLIAWRATAAAIWEQPWFGYGHGEWTRRVDAGSVPSIVSGLPHAHNFYLNVALDWGIPLTGILLALLASPVFGYRQSNYYRGNLAPMAFLLVGSSVASVFDVALHHLQVVAPYWLVLSALAVAGELQIDRG